MIKSYSIKVYGKVQGVGFRFYTQKTARELGVNGFIKNAGDGSVYIEAEAGPDIIKGFIAWVKTGPEWARVDSVTIQEMPGQGFVGFSIK